MVFLQLQAEARAHAQARARAQAQARRQEAEARREAEAAQARLRALAAARDFILGQLEYSHQTIRGRLIVLNKDYGVLGEVIAEDLIAAANLIAVETGWFNIRDARRYQIEAAEDLRGPGM